MFLKNKILFYNTNVIMNKNAIPKTLDELDVFLQDLKYSAEQPLGKYGLVVPNTIPGSAPYMTKVLNDVQAVCAHLRTSSLSERPPTFFLTFTQNDAWPELHRQHPRRLMIQSGWNCSLR